MITLKEKIQAKQNEETMLKIQFCARSYYNNAEVMSHLAWICCLLSACTIPFLNNMEFWIQILGPLIFDTLVLALSDLQSKYICKAAEYRRYFDAYVLDIDYNYTESEKREIEESALEYCAKHKEQCELQINNTCNDDPPGLKDWYDLSNCISDEDVQFDCQQQNLWWEKELDFNKLIVFCIAIVFTYVMMVILSFEKLHWQEFLRIILAAPLLLKTLKLLVDRKKYIKIRNEIDGAVKTLRCAHTDDQIKDLQKQINQLRKCTYVGVNFLHKVKARSLSEIYKESRYKRNE